MSSNQESSQTSDDGDSLVQSSSIITYSGIGDSSVVDTYNQNEQKSRDKPSSDGVPFYRRRRFWAMCIAINVVLSAMFIPLLYLVIIPAAAQGAINKSQMTFQSINITNATNDSFIMNMLGESTGAGPFRATVEFNGNVSVYFNGAKLGTSALDSFSVSNGEGVIESKNQTFNIEDKSQFVSFATSTLKDESFKWNVQGIASVRTFGYKVNNLKLNKDIIIPGSNGFNTSSLIDLKVSQNPDKTLTLNILASLYNPSPIGIELGDMDLQLSYNGTIIANATSKGVFIKTQNNTLAMSATAGLPTNGVDLFNVLKVMSAYLTGTPLTTNVKILSVVSPNGKIDWINEAVANMNLTSVVGQTKSPQLLSSIDFGEMNMKFSPDAPFSPTISSKNATAKISLPFNIDFKVLAVKQKLTLFYKGKPISTIETPQTNVTNIGSDMSLDIPETQMIVDKDSEDAFKDFLVDLTISKGVDINVVGTTDSIVDTVFGDNLPIEGLPFNITTSLQGFNQFNNDGSPPIIDNFTILGGTSSELIVGVFTTLTNPSQYSSSLGQVAFNLFYREQMIGTAVIQDLTVAPGPNSLPIVITLNDPENNAGKDVMTAFLTGQSASVDIRGFEGSTSIPSLIPAFKAIDIPTNLPPIQQQFVSSAKLVVDNQTSTTLGIIEMANTFVAPLSIYTMKSSFSYNGLVLGTVEQDIQNNPIFIPGNSVKTLEFPVSMTPDPVTSFSMLRNLAIQNNMDVSVLDSLIVLSKVDVPGVDPNVQPSPDAIRAFDLGKFITTALAKIPVTVNLDSQVAVGYYFMSITYQQNITVETDSSILNMMSTIAQPLINQVLAQSQMTFDSMLAFNIDVFSFDVNVVGLISNTGPLPAQINFPDGIYIYSNGVIIGKVDNIPTITADPLTGAKLNGVSRFEIADTTTFTSFAESLLTSGTIVGDIEAGVVVTAAGVPIGPITIQKSIPLSGFSNFQVKLAGITSPSPGNFATQIALTNPSALGIELGTVVFDLFVEGNKASTITGDNIIIVPNNVSILEFHGPIDLNNPIILQSILTKTPMTAQGVSVKPPKATGDVVWLTDSFKSFNLTVPFDLSALTPASPPPPQ